jgi:lysozyme family protein
MKSPTFEQIKDEYSRLWATAVTRSSFKAPIDATATKILANKEKYEAVGSMTKVPWFVVGLIHQMEAGCRFTCHLHNGDPLSARTVNVPKGRPLKGTPVFPWEDSACDALLMKGMNTVADWTVERICYELERYNGFGYRLYHPTTLTPYLWSGTTLYARGKYIKDGKWSSEAVSTQSGAMAILRKLMELDPSILAAPAAAETVADNLPAPPAPEETSGDSFSKANEKQMSIRQKIMLWLGIGGAVGQTAQQLMPNDPLGTAEHVLDTGQRIRGVGQRGHELGSWAFSFSGWPYALAAALAGGGLYWLLCHYLPSRQETP